MTEQKITQELITKLETAEEGSRKLDAEIAVAVGHADQSATYDSSNDCLVWLEPHEMGLSEPLSAPLHNYTTSIDAAITLIPKDLRYGFDNELDTVEAWAQNPKELVPEDSGSNSATPALALCIAALKAKETLPPCR